MPRLYVVCEGQTEESFVNNLLTAHFATWSVEAIPLVLPSKLGATARHQKGGWTSYSKARHFIRLTMEQMHSADTWFTTMFDLYALPRDFPEAPVNVATSPSQRVEALEAAFKADICTDALWRFTPYIQLHEYEALLLAQPNALLTFYPEHGSAVAALAQEIADMAPESINDGPSTAPSKRIIRHIPEYEGAKVVVGTLTALEIGLPTLRASCPHFDRWMQILEELF